MDALCTPPAGNGVPIPTFSNIYSVTNESEIDNLNNRETTTYKPRTFIPFTPFLCQDVSKPISQHEGSAKQVLLKVIEKMKEFDMNIQGVDPSYIDKAKDKSKDIVKWFYLAASINLSISLVATAPVNSRGIKKMFKEMTENCISERI